jgi:6-phosphogluconolactonase (cycloisomerase 2 family)
MMRMFFQSIFSRVTTVMVGVCMASGFAAGASKTPYVITNDDIQPPSVSTVSFYTIGTDGSLNLNNAVNTDAFGIGGGYFAKNRVQVLQSGKAQCVYVSEASSSNIVGINIRTMKVAGAALGSGRDSGFSNGIGLAMNPKYLYASFSDVNNIGTFRITPGCKLNFDGDLKVVGTKGGILDGMAAQRNMLVVTYTDGSIESFNISAGKPVSNGDKQNSTGSRGGNAYPSGISITQDGHYAIFGDVATSTIVEVSDISSGKLMPTVVYHLGNAISSSNIILSPDESLLYISNTQGDRITAAFFDTSTGVVSKGCTSGRLRGYSTNWSYLAGLSLEEATRTGGMVYVAEFGAPSSIGEVKVTSAGGKCTLKELPTSPAADPNSQGLLSIGSFLPH